MTTSRSHYARRLDEFPDVVRADNAAFEHRGQWAPLFRERIGPSFNGRIIFEVGCADAAFLSRIAAKHPDAAFIGLDWKYKAIHDGGQRVTRLGLHNLILLRGRAQDVRKIFGDAEVDEIWVFHPEPCAGAAELKNRLIAEPFLLDAQTVLRNSSSTLSLKTDHAGYYQWVLSLFGVPEPESFRAARDGLPLKGPRVRARDLMLLHDIPGPSDSLRRAFSVAACSVDFWNDPVAMAQIAGHLFAGEATVFESRFIRKRQPIFFMGIARK